MAHIIPQYDNGPFHVGANCHGESINAPADVFGDLDKFASETGAVRATCGIVIGQWWCRLSAPGYLDCTEWDGPHDSEQEARDAIQRDYDVDPDTGKDPDDDLDESEDS